jgi:lysophospholipase L1-like esterase
MQKSRRRRRLEQHLLPVGSTLALALFACATRQGMPRDPADASRHSAPILVAMPDAAGNTAESTSPTPKASERANEETPTPAEPPELPRGTLVLHVGDSFAGSLGVPLAKRLKAAGLRSVLEYRTSSYIPTWASSGEVSNYVSRYSPDLVLVTLGANEFELSAPDTRAGAVRRLVKQLEGRPCVWISPPRWKPDTGILSVIRENSKPCRFLDSDTIVRELARKPDKIHPSDVGREVWADAVFTWLVHERQTGAERPWQFRNEE